MDPEGAAPPPLTPQPDPQPQQPSPQATTRTSSCQTCGSTVVFVPGTTSMRCSSCQAVQAIGPGEDTVIDEHSYDDWVATHGGVEVTSIGGSVLACEGCGARTDTTDLATTCQFCGGHLITLTVPEGVLPPEAVVPFGVDADGAHRAFQSWVRSRWLAPSALKKVVSTDSLRGTYVPHWTYDARTSTAYRGERGDYYYVTRTRTVSDGKGGTTTETYQDRETRWSRRNGSVGRDFDDVVVPATGRLDAELLEKMGPWRLDVAQPYQPDYLSGFSALRYDVDPDTGVEDARKQMRAVIDTDCRRDIGGDEQRVLSMDVTYAAVMFKLMLMPVWLAAYAFRDKRWQVMVNASTAEVVGDRPWSRVKIGALVALAVALIGVVVWLGLSSSGDASGAAGPAGAEHHGAPTAAVAAPQVVSAPVLPVSLERGS